ncbi:protein of unknown function [uncultured Woeseiaceae bacterium]|uniref:Uncharacterized protein n=1 Tax=uncultured Woeseiaceae bacterium TaxID=1983305 RepID=A0A7D9H7D5_9GAMM|nr:protein of unknown function [uncultured Woeseiaceae bacterium]
MGQQWVGSNYFLAGRPTFPVVSRRPRCFFDNCFKAFATRGQSLQRAAGIRIRAERKTGQLLAKIEGMGSRGGDRKSSRTTRLDDLSISQDQSSKWQKLAEPSDKEFERALVNGIANTVYSLLIQDIINEGTIE